jgi:hypothetical protein
MIVREKKRPVPCEYHGSVRYRNWMSGDQRDRKGMKEPKKHAGTCKSWRAWRSWQGCRHSKVPLEPQGLAVPLLEIIPGRCECQFHAYLDLKLSWTLEEISSFNLPQSIYQDVASRLKRISTLPSSGDIHSLHLFALSFLSLLMLMCASRMFSYILQTRNPDLYTHICM